MRRGWTWGPLALLAMAAAAGCLGDRPLVDPPPVTADAETPVRFVVVGDTGTGEVAQYAVAAAIGKACRERGCDLVVHTGDIVYDVGVSSPRDPQFESKFERPYGSLGLPVYLVLGNHDVGGDPSDEAALGRWKTIGDRMVEYSNRTDRTTDAWRMPARWYGFSQGNVSFAAFDTSAFLYAPLESDPDGPLHRAIAEQASFAAAAWPANASWRFAVGHHPYVSNGKHGNTALYSEGLDGSLLATFFEEHVCGKADVLLAGHDHDLQWLAPVASCGDTRFLVSGAGAKPRALEDPLRNAALYQLGSVLGFWWVEVSGDRLTTVALDADAKVLYEGVLTRAPRPAPPAAGNATSSATATATAP